MADVTLPRPEDATDGLTGTLQRLRAMLPPDGVEMLEDVLNVYDQRACDARAELDTVCVSVSSIVEGIAHRAALLP